MTTSIVLGIYAAILSTLLAIPKVKELFKDIYSPIKFLCRTFSGVDAKKEELPKITYLDLFDITIVNKTKENLFLSKLSLELKNKGDKSLLTYGYGLINVNFPNKIEPGALFREYARISDDIGNLYSDKILDIKTFSEFRISVQSSIGKTYKSKWFTHNITMNMGTVKYEKLENLEEYKEMTGDLLN